LAVERNTPCTSLLLAVKRLHSASHGVGGGEKDTQCTSKQHVVKSDTTFTSFRTKDKEKKIPAKNIYKNFHGQRRLLMVLFWLYVRKSLPECIIMHYSGIGIFSGSQLPQSGIGIPASGPVQYRCSRHGLVRHCPAIIIICKN
jgi:hypothetical protein